MAWDDYRYTEEAYERNLMIRWKCNKCGDEREDYPGINEGGTCHCGGEYIENGESYEA